MRDKHEFIPSFSVLWISNDDIAPLRREKYNFKLEPNKTILIILSNLFFLMEKHNLLVQFKMKILAFAALLVIVMNSNLQAVSSTTCYWNNNYDCPIGFAYGTRPTCDYTKPTDLGNGLFGVYICTADSTMFGESYRVTLPVGGTIQSVNIMA
jgi:hypothetical protein